MLSPPVEDGVNKGGSTAAVVLRPSNNPSPRCTAAAAPGGSTPQHLSTNWLNVTNDFTSPSMSPLVGGDSWGLGSYGKEPYQYGSSALSPLPSPQSDRLLPTWDVTEVGSPYLPDAAAAQHGLSHRQRLHWGSDGPSLATPSPCCCCRSSISVQPSMTPTAVQPDSYRSSSGSGLLLPSLTLAPSAFSTMDLGAATREGLRPSNSTGFLLSQHNGNHNGGQSDDWLYSFVDKLRRSSIATNSPPFGGGPGLPNLLGSGIAPAAQTTSSLFGSLFPPLKHRRPQNGNFGGGEDLLVSSRSDNARTAAVAAEQRHFQRRLSSYNPECSSPQTDMVEAALRETISAAAAVAAIGNGGGGNTPMTPTTTASTNSGYNPQQRRQQQHLFRSHSCNSNCPATAATAPGTPPGLLPPPAKRTAGVSAGPGPLQLSGTAAPNYPDDTTHRNVAAPDRDDGGGAPGTTTSDGGPLTALTPLPSVPPLSQLGFNVPVKLFVNRVPKWMGDDALAKVFEPYGCVLECNILRNSFGPKGCAFVKYNSIVEAHQAILNLHGKHVLNEDAGPMQIKYADGELERLGISLDAQPGGESVKVFVGCLPRRCTEQDLMETFQEFGYVDEVFVLRDAQKQPKCSAFVTFTRMDAALKAIKALDKKCLLPNAKRPLEVRLAESKVSRLLSRDKTSSGGLLLPQHPLAQPPPPPPPNDHADEDGGQAAALVYNNHHHYYHHNNDHAPPYHQPQQQQQRQSSGCLAPAASSFERNAAAGGGCRRLAVYAP